MYAFIKFLSLWIYPLGISVFLCCIALLLLLRSRVRLGIFVLLVSTLNLWVFSTAVVAETLIRYLERGWPDQPVQALPKADAVMVLGGAFSSGNGRWLYPNASGSVDRYWHAARIVRAGKAPLIILSGGRSPHLTAGPTEAQMGATFLGDLGVPAEALVLDEASLTTRDHAVFLKQFAQQRGIQSLMVVTSARHMRRAIETLQGSGVDLIPVATDFTASDDPAFTIRRYLPSAGALAASTGAVHEIVGFWFYRVTGDG